MQSWGCQECFRVKHIQKLHLFLNWEWSQCAQPYSASLHIKPTELLSTSSLYLITIYASRDKVKRERQLWVLHLTHELLPSLHFSGASNSMMQKKKKKKFLSKWETRWFSQLCDAMGNRQQKRQLIGMMSSTQKHWNHFVTKRHNPINYEKNISTHCIVISN